LGGGGGEEIRTANRQRKKKIKDPHKQKRITFIFLKIKYFMCGVFLID